MRGSLPITSSSQIDLRGVHSLVVLGVPTLNRTAKRKCIPQLTAAPFRAPKNKAEQRAIAHILGTLDDKIELNRRMNETLEAMAQELFKSWFVDFEPVHAKMEGRLAAGQASLASRRVPSRPHLPSTTTSFPDQPGGLGAGGDPGGMGGEDAGGHLPQTSVRIHSISKR